MLPRVSAVLRYFSMMLGCAFACIQPVFGETAPADAAIDAVIFAPKVGTPIAAAFRVALNPSLPKDRTLVAEVVPGSLTDMPASCPLGLTASVGGAFPGAGAVTVTLGAPSVPCGGGHHGLALRLTAQQSGEPPVVLAQTAVSLWIRFEPSLDVTPPTAQPAELRDVGCWVCLAGGRPWLTDFLAPQVRVRSQSFFVKNMSVGKVYLRSSVGIQGSSPGSAAGALKIVSADTTGLAPNDSTTLQLEAQPKDDLAAGAYDLRLLLAATEAGTQSNPLSTTTAIPIRLNLRYGVSWAFLALLIGLIIGRAIALVQDPVYAAKLEFLDHLRMVRLHALAIKAPEEVIDALNRIEAELDSVYGPIPDPLRARLTEIENSLSTQLAAVRKAAVPGGVAAVRSGAKAVAWLSWLVAGSQPPAKVGADVVRPFVQLAIIAVGLLTGIRLNYLDSPTFGANGILDLLPVVVWSATSVAVAKSLDSFARK